MKKLLLAFALVVFPTFVVHASAPEEAPAAVCETVDTARAQAKELGVEIIVLENESLKNFRSDFEAEHGQQPVTAEVEALVFVKVQGDGKLELGLIVFVGGCAVQSVPPGFLDVQMILPILEGNPA